MAKSPVDSPVASNEPADRLVAEARPDGVVVDYRKGTVEGPKKSFSQMAEDRRKASAARKAKAAPATAPKARKGRPAVERKAFDPRANEICYEVLPTMPADAMSGREWIRYRVVEELAGPIGIWVLISAIGRGGNKEAAVFYATCQMAAEMEQNDTIRILFRWALTFGVYPIALLEDGDFERWSNIAYRMEKWATEHKHPELANFQKVLKVNRIKRTEPNTPVVEVALPYEQVQRIAFDMGIEPIAVQARVSSRQSKFSVPGKKVVIARSVRKDVVEDDLPPMADDYMAPAAEPVTPSPVVAPAPVAEMTDELEDEPTQEVALPAAPVAEPVPEAPVAEETENAPVVPDEPVGNDEPEPQPTPQPEPTPVPTQVVDEDTVKAAALAGCTVEEFLLKPSGLQRHYRNQLKVQQSPPATKKATATAPVKGRRSVSLSELKGEMG